MRNEKELNSCLYGEELVAYIYGELPARGRDTFERHLLDCGGCTAELAEISLSRLGVFEWHRDEFMPLETPRFVIPFEPNIDTAPKYSWLDGLRGLFASPTRLATAGAAFAALIFAGVLSVSYFSGPSDQIALGVDENVTAPRVEVLNSAPSVIAPVAITASDPIDGPKQKREFKSAAAQRRVRPVQVKAVRPPKQQVIPATSAQSVPRLGNFVETEDTSLRLTDLVANIDTKD